jgi:hypothetical protein
MFVTSTSAQLFWWLTHESLACLCILHLCQASCGRLGDLIRLDKRKVALQIISTCLIKYPNSVPTYRDCCSKRFFKIIASCESFKILFSLSLSLSSSICLLPKAKKKSLYIRLIFRKKLLIQILFAYTRLLRIERNLFSGSLQFSSVYALCRGEAYQF